MNKKIAIVIALLAAGLLLVLFYLKQNTPKTEREVPKAKPSLIEEQLPDPSTNEPKIANPAEIKNSENIVGGDKDEHGCIGSAGYSWCEKKEKCLRPWEEKCE